MMVLKIKRLLIFLSIFTSAVRYSWYKFRSNNWVYPGHPYHFNSQSGYLYFSEVQWTDGRQYFCIVTLTARQGMVKSTEQPLARTSYGRYLIIKPGSEYKDKMSLVVRKPVFGVSDQVRHKPGCTATKDG